MAADHDARGNSWGPWAALVLALVAPACIRHDDLKIRVFNDGPAGVELQNLHVFGGAEKAWWSTVAPGTSVGTLLRPRGEPELSMTCVRAGRTVNWEGPKLTAGQGYTVHIHVDPTGAVTEQHCLMPCMLP
jgi:hypothetical protein